MSKKEKHTTKQRLDCVQKQKNMQKDFSFYLSF